MKPLIEKPVNVKDQKFTIFKKYKREFMGILYIKRDQKSGNIFYKFKNRFG